MIFLSVGYKANRNVINAMVLRKRLYSKRCILMAFTDIHDKNNQLCEILEILNSLYAKIATVSYTDK